MTISSTAREISYTGNASTTEFAVPFAFFDETEIEVIERVIATGAETVKQLTTHYTVSGGGGGTGTVTAVSAPAGTVEWHIRGATDDGQATDLAEGGAFASATIEEIVDRLAARVLELERDLGRAVRVPKTDDALDALDNAVDRAGGFLGFDANGVPAIYDDVLGDDVAVSGFMSPLLAAGSGDSFLAGLGLSAFMYGLKATASAGALLTALGFGAFGVTLAGTADAAAALSALGIDAAMPRGYIDGLTLSNSAGDASNDIDIAAGACRSDDDAENIVLSSALTKQLDAAWAVGTNAGGLDTGAEGTSRWYYVWLIKRTDTDVVDVLLSESATAPTLPSGYTKKRYIGAVYNQSTSIIRPFKQFGDWFQLVTAVQDASITLGDARQTLSLSVPSGRRMLAQLRLSFTHATAPKYAVVQAPDETDATPSPTAVPGSSIASQVNSQYANSAILAMTSTAGAIAVRGSAASCVLLVHTYGYFDRRGRDA